MEPGKGEVTSQRTLMHGTNPKPKGPAKKHIGRHEENTCAKKFWEGSRTLQDENSKQQRIKYLTDSPKNEHKEKRGDTALAQTRG